MSKRSKANQKRQSRAHELWATEQTDEGRDKRAGEFVVLLFSDSGTTKTSPMNHTQAVKVWREYLGRAMIFLASDFTCKTREAS